MTLDPFIQAAINALPASGGAVYVSPGRHVVDTLTIPNAPITLYGAGGKASVLVARPGLTGPVLKVLGPTLPGQFGVNLVHVRDLGIDAAGGTGDGAHGLELAGAVYCGIFAGLNITGARGHSTYLHSAPGGERPAYNKIVNCNIENGQRDAIRLGDDYPAGTYAEHNEVSHCAISFHGGDGLSLTGNNNRIHHCQFDQVGSAIVTRGAENTDVDHCTFDRCRVTCVWMNQGGSNAIDHNWFMDYAGLVSPPIGAALTMSRGTSGNRIIGNGWSKTGEKPGGNGWRLAVYEDVGVGQSGVGFYGPNVYIGNVFAFNPNQFLGGAPILVGNSSSTVIDG